MTVRIILGNFLILLFCTCSWQPSKKEGSRDEIANHKIALKSGLLIENKVNRGTNYTDPQGNDYSIRYIPISITNDSTVSLHVQVVFATEYNYPHPNSDIKFRLIPLPKEWAMDGVEISESMFDAIPNFIENPVLSETIRPNEKIVFALGSLYPRPAELSGVLPRKLLLQEEAANHPDCDWTLESERSSGQHMQLGLKIRFGEICKIISCGQIYFNEH